LTTDDSGKCKAADNNCDSGAPYLTKDGCKADCPADSYVRKFTDPDTNKKSCIQDICGDDTILKQSDGTCVACAEHTKKKAGASANDPDTCVADTCIERQKLLKNGECGACPDYQVTKGTVGTSKECE